jgi:transcriptional regulator with XRE-family HTH domain
VPKSASTLFRERLKELRKERKLTQEQAAEKIGIPAKVYQFYELGLKKNPGLNTLEKICDGFGVTLAEFFDGKSR